jgi:hypothetical protein
MLRLARAYLIAVGAVVMASSGMMAEAFADGPKPVPDAVQTAQAQVPSDPDPWRVDATLYGWLMSVSGNVTARGQTIDTNASFLDLVQHSDSLAAFMGYFEADKGKVGFYTDLVFARMGFSASQLNYRNPIAGLRLTLTTQEALIYQMFIAEMGGVYEFARWPGSEDSFTAIDGLLGFRYWNMSVDASLDAQLNVDFSHLGLERQFGLAIARSDAIQWIDPLVGVRLRHQFTPNQRVFVRGDVGGFGIGSSITWQAVGAYSYSWQFTGYQIAALIGFRALGVNYSVPGGANGFALNETMYGPIIGVSFRW